MREVLVIAVRELRSLSRDRVSLFWILAFPLMYAVFFGSLFGGESGDRAPMPVMVVDEAGTDASRALVDRLRASEGLAITASSDADAARTAVRHGDQVAFVRIDSGFSGGYAVFERDQAPLLQIGVDPSRRAERGVLEGLVAQAVFGDLSRGFTDPAAMRDDLKRAREQLASASDVDDAQRQALLRLFDALDGLGNVVASAGPADPAPGGSGLGVAEVVDVTADATGPRTAYEITFPSAMVWGLVSCALAFAVSLARARRSGTWLRLRVSPVSRARVLAGQALACTIAGVAASGLLLAVGVVFLGVRVESFPMLLVAMVAAAAAFTGLMLVLSVIGRTESAVAGGSWAIVMPLAMLGGGMIPLVAMPAWLQKASVVSPFRWAILGIEGAVWRDFGLADLMVPLAVLLGFAVGLFALGYAIFRRLDG